MVCWILCPDLWKQNTFTLSEIRMECVEFIQKVQRYQQRIESDSRKKKGRGNPNTSPSPNPKGKGKIGDFRLGLSLILWKNSKVTLIHFFSSVQFSYSVLSDSLRPHGLQHSRLPCPSPAPRVDSKSLSRWCHPTILSFAPPSPSASNLSQHQGLFKWVSPLHQVAKVLEFQLQHQSFQWTFRTDVL